MATNTTERTEATDQQKVTSEIRPLDDGSARQLGEWLAGEVARIGNWNHAMVQPVDPEHQVLLGKRCYDAVTRFIREGHFPLDVAMHDYDRQKAVQASQATQATQRTGDT